MHERKSKTPTQAAPPAEAPRPTPSEPADESGLDFTPEQWAWLQAQSRLREADYVPTRSLSPGV